MNRRPLSRAWLRRLVFVLAFRCFSSHFFYTVGNLSISFCHFVVDSGTLVSSWKLRELGWIYGSESIQNVWMWTCVGVVNGIVFVGKPTSVVYGVELGRPSGWQLWWELFHCLPIWISHSRFHRESCIWDNATYLLPLRKVFCQLLRVQLRDP